MLAELTFEAYELAIVACELASLAKLDVTVLALAAALAAL
jgi:hypothetical protein